MLLQLHIENVAVIEEANIDFSDGFHVLTGETGAGKSIIIDSINAVTGERTSKDIIRNGAHKAKISAVFCNIGNDAECMLSEMGYEPSEDSLLMISRELNLDGRSTFRLNGSIVPMSIVKEISPYLINIHGQHDNQQLFSPSKHINFIDSFAGIEASLSDYYETYKKMRLVKDSLSNIVNDDELKERKIELLKFQIEEIESASLISGEEEELLSRRDIIRNSESLNENVSYAHSLIGGGDETDGVLSLLKEASDAISEISDYDAEVGALAEKTSSILYEVEEILSEIRELDGKFEYDPNELNNIEERLDIIFRLKQKYGNSVDEILEKYDSLVKELDDITFSDRKIEELKAEYDQLFKEATKKAQLLSEKRLSACSTLCNKITDELAFLDMPNVRFTVSSEIVELNAHGCDKLEFLISANSGEEPRPLTKIASGGELSRIMLAIKTVLSEGDQIGTLIFDEIDTGVSGKTARKIGEKMRQISIGRQVLCVTHLAQIASLADNHLFIEKSTRDGRTFTSVRLLDMSERINEVARIMGGDIITDATLQAAQELIKQ